MVSFWPWKRDSSSTASFEKTLATLSVKIADAQARLDRLRASSRRVKVLWTLYLAFAYTVYAIVLLLVVGYANLGALEWSALAGGPVLYDCPSPAIYLVRTLTTAYFTFRVESVSARLKEYQDERAKTIQKLKDATKYDSTLELIEKYGGEGASPRSGGKKKRGPGDPDDGEASGKQGRGGASNKGTPNRTNLPPPPTANIQRQPQPPSSPATPSHREREPRPADLPDGDALDPTAEFAPNAFAHAAPPLAPNQQQQQVQQQQYAPPQQAEPHWYDRIFDVLLGEDETAARNRIVLICHACRLVNGQAPPGTRSLAELGVWKCMACGASNGVEVADDEARRIVKEALDERAAGDRDRDDDDVNDDSVDDTLEASEAEVKTTGSQPAGPAAAVRARRKGKK
ncbi:protein lunapark [Purpureocillium lavendulum]|uniref:Endoplasmic reticulum junction formation protein lunapark n=1 Tax=Purpureocillium lavendulum TaxID=1247861 RepID=A0AB34FT27_9HYPO|nr:protein lunapark [Purpureocillium lavendulum]